MRWVINRTTGLLATTALAVMATVGMSGTATAAAKQGVCAPGPPVYLTTVVSQWTHWTPDADASTHTGTLFAGCNYFYCWTEGQLYSDNGRDSDTWLRTDDDFGYTDVYVNDVYLDTWGFRNDVRVLPRCN